MATEHEILSAQSELTNGLRRLPAIGNMQGRLAIALTNLAAGKIYYCSVQNIDAAYAGSPFSRMNTSRSARGCSSRRGDTVKAVRVIRGQRINELE